MCLETTKMNYIVLILVFVSLSVTVRTEDDDEGPVIPPSSCEVCKYLAIELRDRLDETGKVKEVIETGHGIDPRKKKKIQYNKSELRLIEAINDPHICDKILEYNMHKERKGSLRFAKGMSETFQTLHGLVDKGVNVELGIPYELWDTPSAEVTQMQRKCFRLVEEYEENIEDWYYNHQDKDILDFLCKDVILNKNDQGCLDEVFVPKEETDEDKSEDKSKSEEKNKGKKKKQKDKGKLKGDVGDGDIPETKQKHEEL